MSGIEYYSWVPFFNSICEEISKIAQNEHTRDYELFLKAKETFHSKHAILQVEYADPFSFLYALAQRNTRHQRDETFSKAKAAFKMTAELPTDWRFPTPSPNTLSLFYTKGGYTSKTGAEVGSNCLWELFDEVFHSKPVSDKNFKDTLSIKNVGVTKLTQALFLINPRQYIPFDTQMNSLPVPDLEDLKTVVDQIHVDGFIAYESVLEKLKAAFPSCYMYEVNLFNVLLNDESGSRLHLSNNYCQISSWADGQKVSDFFEQFVTENAVWTGGPTSESGNTAYPLDASKRGDIVLVRKGTKNLGGIAVILENEYLEGGWNEDRVIKIIWLSKKTGWTDDALAQRIGFAKATDKTVQTFQKNYPETFKLLDDIRNKQRIMVDHASNKYKNIILQGPPGTGKTRLAMQIALWLTSEVPKDISLMDAIDQKAFAGDPDIYGVKEIKLIQFHPAYTYEDFVRGIITKTKGTAISYQVENKTLANIAEEANKPENKDKAYVLIIDEINRANLPAVLGELIFALEYRGKRVSTLYALKDDEGNEDETLVLPHNLYIIGTMNTADRSVGHVDYAIRRRFSFVQVDPDESAITSSNAKLLYQQVSNIFKDHTAQDFDWKQIAIGHSYFLCKDNELKLRLKFDIIPLLNEYVADGILRESAKTEIAKLNA